jgi:hypothetical protein
MTSFLMQTAIILKVITIAKRFENDYTLYELKTPVQERVDALSALLDSAHATPQLVARFEFLQNKLFDRVPISQVCA